MQFIPAVKGKNSWPLGSREFRGSWLGPLAGGLNFFDLPYLPTFCYNGATLIRIFLTNWLGMWTLIVPLFWVAQAAGEPPAHPATAGPIIAESAVPVSPGQLVIQPFAALEFVAGNFTANWQRGSAGGNFRSLQIPVKVTYGLIQNLEIYGLMAFIHNWADQVNDPNAPGRHAAGFSGVSDLALVMKYQLLEETDQRPALSALFAVDFPTGHHYRLNPARLGVDVQGAGVYAFTGGANLFKWLGPVGLYANLWYSIATGEPGTSTPVIATPLMMPVHGRDLITWNLAAEWPLSGPWVALLEWYSTWEVGPLFHRSHEPTSILMGLMPGIEYLINPRWACELGVALDLAGRNSLHGYAPIFTVIMTY
jgi:hypothetical protein